MEDVSLRGKKEGWVVKDEIRKLCKDAIFFFQNFRNLEQPLKFTPKYVIVGDDGRVSQICLRVQSYSFGN